MVARWKREKIAKVAVDAEVLAETSAAVAVAWAGAANLTVHGVERPVIVQVRRGALTRRRLARELRALADELDGCERPEDAP